MGIALGSNDPTSRWQDRHEHEYAHRDATTGGGWQCVQRDPDTGETCGVIRPGRAAPLLGTKPETRREREARAERELRRLQDLRGKAERLIARLEDRVDKE